MILLRRCICTGLGTTDCAILCHLGCTVTASPQLRRRTAARHAVTARQNALMKSKYLPNRDHERRFLVGFKMRFTPFSNGQKAAETVAGLPDVALVEGRHHHGAGEPVPSV